MSKRPFKQPGRLEWQDTQVLAGWVAAAAVAAFCKACRLSQCRLV
jgi:hypothetical protein